MAVCVKCNAKIGFLGGFITTQGRVCEKCRDIEKLSQKIEAILSEPSAIRKCRALLAKPDLIPDAVRLSELDPDGQAELRRSLYCCRVESEAPQLPEDAKLHRAALSDLFREANDSRYLLKLVEVGDVDSACALFAESRREITSDWIGVVRSIEKAGHRARALSLALKLSGVRNREISELVIELAMDADVKAVADWIRGGRFVSVDEIAEFLKRIGERLDKEVLTSAALEKLTNAEKLRLLSLLGRSDRVGEMLMSVNDLDSDLLSAVEKLAAAGEKEVVLAWLKKVAVPGPLSPKIAALAKAIADPETALEIMVRLEEWKLAEDSMPGVDVRAKCRERMEANESELVVRLKKATDLVAEGEFRQAHILLNATIESARGRAPIAALVATAFDALLSMSELDAALSHRGALEIVATRRKVRKALSDEGVVAKSVPLLLEAFVSRCRNFLRSDGLPFFILIGPGADSAGYRRAAELDGQKEARFNQAGEIPDASAISEKALIEPTVVRTFGEALDALSESRGDARPYERATIYGLFARRLLAPLVPKSDNPERTGPKDVAVECAARALAFKPDVAATSQNKWGDFIFTFSGALRHLGYESASISRQQEFWPSWIDESKKGQPTGITLGTTDHLPPLDGTVPFAFEDLYKAPSEIAPSKTRKLWEK